MGLITPAATVLGTCSIMAAVELVCTVHLVFNIFVLASVNSEHGAVAAGVEISPTFQCIMGAWCLLGIPLIIYGGVGAVYYVESHLGTYLYYLLGTFVWAVAWTIIFLKFGSSCSTILPQHAGQSASYVCGVSNGLVLFWMVVLIGAVGSAMYLVWSMKEYCKRRLETELIRYQEPWQMIQSRADEAAMEEAKAMAQARTFGNDNYGGMGPQPGYSPMMAQRPGNWHMPAQQPYGAQGLAQRGPVYMEPGGY